jgi:lipid II:glycine glycyltransferase (peptidoglycan interpeptide bridge formation enzyme)
VVVHRCVGADGTTLAMRAAALVGDVAVDLLAATSVAGRTSYAAYATCWSLVEDCARRGAARYDLAGVDKVRNKGVYDFKRGTGAREVRYLGEWDAASPAPLRVLARRMIQRQRPS